jgi:hypothetical protein
MPVDQSQTTQNGQLNIGNGASWHSQGFTPAVRVINGVSVIKDASVGTPNTNITISIRTDNAGKPSSTVVTSKVYTPAEWEAFSNDWIYIPLTPAILTPATLYWIVLGATMDVGKYYRVKFINPGVYSGGTYAVSGDGGANWTVSFAAGWTHTPGNTTVLSHDHNAVTATKYQIVYTVTGRTAGSFVITFGARMYCYLPEE